MAAVLICFLAWPLLLVVWESLFVEGRLSYGNYLSLFVRKLYRESLCTSLGLSVSTAVLGTALGLPISYVIHRSRRAKGFLMALTSVPLTFSGLVVAYLYFLIPRTILTLTVAWSNMDWSLIEAAQSLGAGRSTILLRVLLPMLLPSLLSGSSLLFAVSMGAFGTAFALTGTSVKILPMVIYTQVSDMSTDIAQADALAVVLTLVTTGVIVLYERFFRPAGT